MIRHSCGLEAVIRTSQTNQNPCLRFYGCPTLVLGYGIVDECGFELIDGINSFGYAKRDQLPNELSNLTMQLVQSIDERHSFKQELEHLQGNLEAYKTREELKGLQKDYLIKAMEMRKVVLQFRLQVHK
ncbi:hypothetical protein Tco_0214815 [Tanacetum coccineum]